MKANDTLHILMKPGHTAAFTTVCLESIFFCSCLDYLLPDHTFEHPRTNIYPFQPQDIMVRTLNRSQGPRPNHTVR